MEIDSKLPDVGVTIFAVMTALSNENNAINLSQGFPDFDVSPELVALVDRHMRAGHNQYAPMQGILPLREAIADKVKQLYRATYDPITEMTVTSGATEALFCAITSVVKPGDEVVMFEPAYDAYVPVVRLSGGIPVFVPLHHPSYHIDWREVRRAITARTRLIILNSPHNPTGAVLSAEDISELIGLVSKTGVLIVSDEVYEHIIFDDIQHESMACYPELAERSFVISSFGKTYHTTGWKVGYCLAPPSLTREFQKIHQFVNFATSTPVQHAYAEFMRNPGTYSPLAGFYQAKRDFFLSLIESSRFRPIDCRGTYFQLLDYSNITDEPDIAFAKRMTLEHGVAAIPTSVFCHNGSDQKVLRFCFAKKDETLRAAAEILSRI
ncbi:MAG: methionine aminotransferase [Desulfobacterales bacterium]|jgi:methionine aminotransferase|nr:methionine aminotransferase [Desulfobacterales bacterium]